MNRFAMFIVGVVGTALIAALAFFAGTEWERTYHKRQIPKHGSTIVVRGQFEGKEIANDELNSGLYLVLENGKIYRMTNSDMGMTITPMNDEPAP